MRRLVFLRGQSYEVARVTTPRGFALVVDVMAIWHRTDEGLVNESVYDDVFTVDSVSPIPVGLAVEQPAPVRLRSDPLTDSAFNAFVECDLGMEAMPTQLDHAPGTRCGDHRMGSPRLIMNLVVLRTVYVQVADVQVLSVTRCRGPWWLGRCVPQGVSLGVGVADPSA
jgi:hypothetical protein